ncbi:TrbG/VirB9 family P-type conjugative transfer protein [Paraburkholderia sp. J8-2]|uniref:TrbG/VirB9 family P-type conjugative transfer protein n=1 Tax=Paraburkholderia sp. J8-2 TaxID=2805440 RepID=UPI002AB5FC43|nr:TrbG/VirB9 family P-type conjugative transfer protein [Paraburkholderia sp. J8-2]
MVRVNPLHAADRNFAAAQCTPRGFSSMKTQARALAWSFLFGSVACCAATPHVFAAVPAALGPQVVVSSTAEVPVPSPLDDRIVRFTYSADAVFPLLAELNQDTHIQLEKGEGVVEKPALGDTMQWRVSGGPRNLYVKPVRAGISTSLTLVTNKRTYEFLLVSSAPGGKFYQQVSFDYPDDDAQVRLAAEQDATQFIAQKRHLESETLTPPLDPTSYHYGYTISGDAPFKPVAVFDDGRQTFFRLPNVQDLPAVFIPDSQGRLSLIVTRPKGEFVVADRIADKFVIKSDDQVVTVESDRVKHWWNRAFRGSASPYSN